jgi:hypothetical protein
MVVFHYGVGRGAIVGRDLGVGVILPEDVGVAVGVALGVGVGLGAAAQYLPPVFSVMLGSRSASWGRAVGVETASPPQTIISLPVHTAVCPNRAVGASLLVIAVQLSLLGLYLPPVAKRKNGSNPPQTIISRLSQTAL